MGEEDWMSRRLVCAMLTFIFEVTSIPPVLSQTQNGMPTAQISDGEITGSVLSNGIRAYLGVPFAAAPVGALRWHEPIPVKKWTGVYDASSTKPACAQRGSEFSLAGAANEYSEDCLYLNVWVPSTAKQGAKLPVMVFLYGGGFESGSASNPAYSGVELARKGVIAVNVAYRVGLFGYFAHPELSRESGHNASGDWGSLDQVAGLRWIQHNIASFGGNPSNVMVMGQSAGSESVYELQASPLTHGLFAKLAGWSGADLTPGGQVPRSLAEGEVLGVMAQHMLKAGSMIEMRAMPWEQVLAVIGPPRRGSGATGGGIETRPIVDGYFLQDLPDRTFKAAKQNDVPLYTSSTQEDLGSAQQFYNSVKTVADLRTLGNGSFGAFAERFMELFPATSDEEARRVARIVSGNTGFGVSNRDWARDQALHGKQPVFLAQWAHVPPRDNTGLPGADMFGSFAKLLGNGATHGSDIQYWLGTYARDANRAWTSWDKELSGKMQDTLVAFAKTGNPSTSAVTLPRYDPKHEERIVFGDSIYVEKMNTEQIEFLRAHPVPRIPPADAR